MVLEGAYFIFVRVMLVYVCCYNLFSDLPVFLDDILVFSTDLVINNLEVDLVASRSEALHYGVVGFNAILFLLCLEGGDKDCVGVVMLGGQYVLVTAAISTGEASIVICVNLGYWFGPNVHIVQSDGFKGIRCEGFWSVGGIFGIGLGGAYALQSLGKMNLDSFVGGISLLEGVSVG